MSWSVELSVVESTDTASLAAHAATYLSDWRAQYELPAWLSDRRTVRSIETSSEAWGVVEGHVLRDLPGECTVVLTPHLCMFKAARIECSQDAHWLISASAERRMRRLARSQDSWPIDTLRARVIELRDEIRSFLSTLRPTSVGVVRLYEWGKF